MASSGPSGSPVSIGGMHRSGTTLLARLLAAAGVYMGRPLSTNFESRCFQSLSRDILDQFGCSWAHLEELPPTAVLIEQCRAVEQQVGSTLAQGLAVEGVA